MRDKEVVLSTANLKALEKQVRKLATDFGTRGVTAANIPGQLTGSIAIKVGSRVRDNIAGIADLDGNYLGGDNPNAAVGEVEMPGGWQVVWSGQQIAYLEFGTGLTGARAPYPGPAMGAAKYKPNASRYLWAYKDAKSGDLEWTSGIPAYAPMWNAAIDTRAELREIAAPILQGAVSDAFNL